MNLIEWHPTTESIDAGKHGKDYEIETAKYLLKCLVFANFKNFKFTREKKGVGKFDDLVYIYENENRRRFCLVQLKHVLDTKRKIDYDALSKNKSSYFLLTKYFNHYRESSRSIKNDRDFTNCDLEALIICTNAALDLNLEDIQVKKLKKASLFKKSGKYYQLKVPNSSKPKIFPESYQSEGEVLANELVTFIMVGKLMDITALKKDEHVSLLKKYHVALGSYVIDVSQKKLKSQFLKMTGNRCAVSKFRQCFFDSLSQFCKIYQHSTVEELKKYLKVKSKVALGLKNRLDEIKQQTEFLEGLELQIRPSFGDSSLYPNDLKSLPSYDICEEEVNKEIDDFLNLLIFATEENICEEHYNKCMEPDTLNAFNQTMSNWYHMGSYEDHTESFIKKRNWITKEKMLSQAMESAILFQGKKIKLKQLIDDKNLIPPKTLIDFFCSKVISIGNESSRRRDNAEYYIPRRFNAKRNISIQAITSSQDEVFLMSNFSRKRFQNDKKQFLSEEMVDDIVNFTEKTRIVFIDGDFTEEKFQQFLKTQQRNVIGKNIHWLEHDRDKNILWRNTHGFLSHLRNHISNEFSKETISESDVVNKNLAVIASEPGMGKTTTTNHLCKKLSELSNMTNELHWIIKIPLRNCVEIPIYTNDAEEYLKGIVTFFLSYSTDAVDTFSKTVLMMYIKQGKPISLLLDGFDQLQLEKQQEDILKLLYFCKYNMNLNHLWITTRPHCIDKLETYLGTISLFMKELSEEEQISFLTRYWICNSTVSEKELSLFKKEVQKCNRIFYDDNEIAFLAIPRQLLMFAEVFKRLIITENSVRHPLKITSLLESFLDTMYNLYFEVLSDNTLVRTKKKIFLRKLLDDVHQDFALHYGGLFSSEESEPFDRKNDVADDALLDIGIVYKTEGTFHFNHQVFAEYLTAKRLVDISLRDSTLQKRCAELMHRELSKKKGIFLYLFDLKLTEMYPLHNAVLRGDLNKIKQFTTEEINSEDALGRTTLYYAFCYQRHNIINILVESGGVVKNTDQFTVASLLKQIEYFYDINISERVYVTEEEMDCFQSWYTIIAKQILTSTPGHYSLELVSAYKFGNEVSLCNWVVVQLILESSFHICSPIHVYPLFLILIKNKAPLEFALLFLKRTKTPSLDPDFCNRTGSSLCAIRYISITRYILDSEVDKLVEIIDKHPEDLIDFLSEFLGSSNSPKCLVLWRLFSTYKDLRYTASFGNSISLLLASFEKRATNFGILVKFLFQRKFQCDFEFKELKWNAFLNVPILNYLSFIRHFESVQKFEDKINKGNIITLSEIKTLKILKDFQKDGLFTQQTNLKEAVCRIFHAVWNSSEGIEMLTLLYKLRIAISTNYAEKISGYLLIASQYGWLQSILNVQNSFSQSVEDIARSLGKKKIVKLIQNFTLRTLIPRGKCSRSINSLKEKVGNLKKAETQESEEEEKYRLKSLSKNRRNFHMVLSKVRYFLKGDSTK